LAGIKPAQLFLSCHRTAFPRSCTTGWLRPKKSGHKATNPLTLRCRYPGFGANDGWFDGIVAGWKETHRQLWTGIDGTTTAVGGRNLKRGFKKYAPETAKASRITARNESRQPIFWEFFSGYATMSSSFERRGWQTFTVDSAKRF